MKPYSILLLITIYCSPLLIHGQQFNKEEISQFKKWKITQFDFGLGVENDHYKSMSLHELMAFAKNPAEMQRDLSLFQEEATTVTFGVGFFANISFSPTTNGLGEYASNREFRLGLGIHSPKEAMVTYKNENLDTSIVYCNLHSEFTLEGAYLLKGRWGQRFHWYYGLGLNGGITFGNEMVLISGRYFGEDEHPSMQESNENSIARFEAKSVLYSRLYIPYGLHYSINDEWLIGFDIRTGIGLQKIQGEELNYIQKTGAIIIGAKYRL